MLNGVNLDKVMVLDIETVPIVRHFEDLNPAMQEMWTEKANRIAKPGEDSDPVLQFEKAGIFAEFGKVVCISMAFFRVNHDLPPPYEYQLRLKSFFGKEEGTILNAFNQVLTNYMDVRQNFLCAHNGREFDFPYIARRTLINGLTLPDALDIAGKKPWETNHLLDTMQLWKFGDYKHFTSLPLLANIFDIPTPKDDLDGSEVGRVFYQEGDVERIAHYCEKDVIATSRLLMRFKGLPILRDEDIIDANDHD
jgi:predicted PolB exonuclease-like 3'-5' exonuclease